MSLVNHVNMRS